MNLQQKKAQNANIIIEKLKKALGIGTDTALASFLGVAANTISAWKSRNTLDYELIITKCNDIDFNWLFNSQYANIETKINEINEKLPTYKSNGPPCKDCESKNELIESLKSTISAQKLALDLLTQPDEQKRKAS